MTHGIWSLGPGRLSIPLAILRPPDGPHGLWEAFQELEREKNQLCKVPGYISSDLGALPLAPASLNVSSALALSSWLWVCLPPCKGRYWVITLCIPSAQPRQPFPLAHKKMFLELVQRELCLESLGLVSPTLKERPTKSHINTSLTLGIWQGCLLL